MVICIFMFVLRHKVLVRDGYVTFELYSIHTAFRRKVEIPTLNGNIEADIKELTQN